MHGKMEEVNKNDLWYFSTKLKLLRYVSFIQSSRMKKYMKFNHYHMILSFQPNQSIFRRKSIFREVAIFPSCKRGNFQTDNYLTCSHGNTVTFRRMLIGVRKTRSPKRSTTCSRSGENTVIFISHKKQSLHQKLTNFPFAYH